MYRSAVQTVYRSRASEKAGGTREEGGEWHSLLRLVVCLVLFLAVFLGKGIVPVRLLQVRDEVLDLITRDTDVRAVFSAVGESLAETEFLTGPLGAFAAEVWAADTVGTEPESVHPQVQVVPLLSRESEFYSQGPDHEALRRHFFPYGGESYAAQLVEEPETPEPEPQRAELPSVEEVVPAVGTVLLQADYRGEPLPEHYTMDHLSFGALETVAPVVGHINSGFGYRDHPINGVYQFHGGLDIGGQTGDPIRAFAAGTVEYVGEDTSYGLYLQLDHGNGIKSFYAHCLSICVVKGQEVALGEQVAQVGSSGAATGPHLHLELRCGDLRVDPAYYVECLPKA